MSQKHYNISYLEETGKVLKELKKHTYMPFMSVAEGVIIDLGCGTGFDVINIAGLVNADVKVVGIDHDPEMINRAEASSVNMPRAEFILCEADAIPYGDSSIAGMRAERLIQHLEEPEKVIREVFRVLKQGDPFLIIETDWRSLSLYDKNVEIEEKLNQYLTKKKVNNGAAARKLTSYLENNNFRNIQMEIIPFVVKSLKEANEYLWIGHILKEMLEKKYIDQQEYDLFKSSLEEADKNNYFACSINLVVVSCIK
jgi:ubiquinone/menaquinone biosynthesis C-methylase UbiE